MKQAERIRISDAEFKERALKAQKLIFPSQDELQG